MKRAIYTVRIEGNNAELILDEIDKYFIGLEKRYPNVHVAT